METLKLTPGQAAHWEREPGNSSLLNIQIKNLGPSPLTACRAFVRYAPGYLWFSQQATSEDFAAPNGILLGTEGDNPFTLALNETAVLRFAVGEVASLRLELESPGNTTLEISHQFFQGAVAPATAPPFVPLLLEGLTLTRDSATQLSVAPGSATLVSSEGDRAIATLAATSQHPLSGSDLSDGWHHTFLLSDGTVAFDTAPGGAALPPPLRWIGAYLVESGAIADFYYDGEWFVWKPQRISFNGAIATTATAYGLSVPTGFRCHVQLAGHPGHASFGENLTIEVADGDGALPAALVVPWENNAACFLMSSYPDAAIREFNSAFRWQTTNSSGQILAVRSGNYNNASNYTTFTTLRWKRSSIQ